MLDGLIYANIDQRPFYNKQGSHLCPYHGSPLWSRYSRRSTGPISIISFNISAGNMADLIVEADVNAKLMEMWTDISTVWSNRPTY